MENQTNVSVADATVWKSTKIAKIMKKILEIQQEIKSVHKNQQNPFYGNKYADLNTIWDQVRPLLNERKIVLIQPCNRDEVSSIAYDTESDEWLKSSLLLNPVKNSPDAMASAVTYGRRYTLNALLVLMFDEDDDGNKASGNTSKKDTQGTKTKKTTKDTSETGESAPHSQDMACLTVNEALKTTRTEFDLVGLYVSHEIRDNAGKKKDRTVTEILISNDDDTHSLTVTLWGEVPAVNKFDPMQKVTFGKVVVKKYPQKTYYTADHIYKSNNEDDFLK